MDMIQAMIAVGQPIHYYPGFSKITGDTRATILLCQFMYWRREIPGGLEWMRRDSQDITEDTGLLIPEQAIALQRLKDLGFIVEDQRPGRAMHYHVNDEAIDALWDEVHAHENH
jgi:hypothetical protein